MLTKKELKTASNEQLLVDYIKSYSMFESNYCLGRGVDRLGNHLRDGEAELLKRGILSEESIQALRT